MLLAHVHVWEHRSRLRPAFLTATPRTLDSFFGEAPGAGSGDTPNTKRSNATGAEGTPMPKSSDKGDAAGAEGTPQPKDGGKRKGKNT